MSRHYPAELRRETCERMLADEAVKELASELGISQETRRGCHMLPRVSCLAARKGASVLPSQVSLSS